eukprot:UN21425
MSCRVKMSGRRVGSGRVDILRPERTSAWTMMFPKNDCTNH